MLVHASHVPHGSPPGLTRQFSALPTMRATVVLPQPRGPQNKNAWCTRLVANALPSVRVTCSCPTTSENALGRYLRARTRYDTRSHYTRRVCRYNAIVSQIFFAADTTLSRRSGPSAVASRVLYSEPKHTRRLPP